MLRGAWRDAGEPAMIRALLALLLLATPALAQEAPRQPDWQAIAMDFRAQLHKAIDERASLVSDLARVKRELEAAQKPVEQMPAR